MPPFPQSSATLLSTPCRIEWDSSDTATAVAVLRSQEELKLAVILKDEWMLMVYPSNR
jgi:hypothetical protein